MSELDKDIADIKAGLESIGKVMANFSTGLLNLLMSYSL